MKLKLLKKVNDYMYVFPACQFPWSRHLCWRQGKDSSEGDTQAVQVISSDTEVSLQIQKQRQKPRNKNITKTKKLRSKGGFVPESGVTGSY